MPRCNVCRFNPELHPPIFRAFHRGSCGKARNQVAQSHRRSIGSEIRHGQKIVSACRALDLQAVGRCAGRSERIENFIKSANDDRVRGKLQIEADKPLIPAVSGEFPLHARPAIGQPGILAAVPQPGIADILLIHPAPRMPTTWQIGKRRCRLVDPMKDRSTLFSHKSLLTFSRLAWHGHGNASLCNQVVVYQGCAARGQEQPLG